MEGPEIHTSEAVIDNGAFGTRTIRFEMGRLAQQAAGAAHAGDGPFTANVGLVSDYAYRGYSQTDERPALQGGFDVGLHTLKGFAAAAHSGFAAE